MYSVHVPSECHETDCFVDAYLEYKSSLLHQSLGVVQTHEVPLQLHSKMLVDCCLHSSPNKPPSSEQGLGSSSGIQLSWMMEYQGRHLQYQHDDHPLMQTVPLVFQW